MARKKPKKDAAAFAAEAEARGMTYAQAQKEETAQMLKEQMDKKREEWLKKRSEV